MRRPSSRQQAAATAAVESLHVVDVSSLASCQLLGLVEANGAKQLSAPASAELLRARPTWETGREARCLLQRRHEDATDERGEAGGSNPPPAPDIAGKASHIPLGGTVSSAVFLFPRAIPDARSVSHQRL